MNYRVIGTDGQPYGPVDESILRQWLAERRLHGQTLVQPEGVNDWKPLATLPEFAEDLRAQTLAAPPLVPTPPPDAAPSAIPEGDYHLGIGDCLSRGMDLLQRNFGTLFVATLLYLLIEGFIVGLLMIPFIGPLFSLGNILVVGPLMGGVCYVGLRVLRGLPTSAGDVFAGFRLNFGHLILGNLIPGLLAGLCMIPAAIALLVAVLPAVVQNREPGVVGLVLAGFIALLCAVPVLYLQTCWSFTLPLIMDKGLDFWTAMGASRRRVTRHFWKVLGFLLLCWLILAAGMALCGVGLLFAAPFVLAAVMYAYTTLFCEAPAPRP